MYTICFTFLLLSGATDQQCRRSWTYTYDACRADAIEQTQWFRDTGLYRSVTWYCTRVSR